MFFVTPRLMSVILTVIASTVVSHGRASDDTLSIVFDASGSMWEQSGSRDRLTIAKDAVDSLLGELPQSLDVGMTVYGHRRKGDCTDIEIMPSLARGQLRQRLQRVTARGKTPLGAAIEKTAGQLAQTDSNARIIALTDGLETCGYNLCDLANTLKQTGVGLTIDVVGFDLEGEDVSSLKCLTDMTGGAYYSAVGFEGLSDAFASIAAKSVATLSDFTRETTELAHAAKAELSSQFEVAVNAELPQGKMYMLTVVPKGSPDKTMTEGASSVLQLGNIQGSGQNVHSMTLRKAVLGTGAHEVRVIDMMESRVVLSSDVELFQPGQLSDTEKEEVVAETGKVNASLGSFVLESSDRASAGRFLTFTVTPTGAIAVIKGMYRAHLVIAGTTDGEMPTGSTETLVVINNEQQKSLMVKVPDQPGNYELRVAKDGQQKIVARLPVIVQ